MLNWTVLNGNSNLCLYAVRVLAGDCNHSYGDAKDPVAGCRQNRWKIENFLMSTHSVWLMMGVLIYAYYSTVCNMYVVCTIQHLCVRAAWCAPFGM